MNELSDDNDKAKSHAPQKEIQVIEQIEAF